MKVLQLCNKAPYPANDGSSIAMLSIAEGLADNGVELHLLPINTKKHFKPEENIPSEIKQKTNYKSVYQNTDTTAVGAFKNLFTKESYFVSRFYFEEYKNALIQKLQQHQFKFIIIDGVFMASYIPVIRKYSKAKVILRTHNVEHQIWNRHLAQEKNAIKKIYLTLQNNRLKQFELNAFSACDAIVTITDEDKKIISQLVPNKAITTCLTGINLNQYQLIPQAKKPNTVFHFASMDWMPNIEAVDWLMAKVWSNVTQQLPDAKLVLAGRGMPEKFKQLANNNITVIDSVENSKDFYSTYDIMLVPLWSGSGLRIKLVEGLAYGKAIITTSIGAEGIPFTQNKDMIVADNEVDFANAIISLLKGNIDKQQLQQNARRLAEQHFNYQTIAANLIDFAHSLK